ILYMWPQILRSLPPKGKLTGLVEAQCECGKIFQTKRYYIATGHTKSCGCRRVIVGKMRTTHGESGGVVEYGIWAAMIRRTTNPNCEEWLRYGGRGIKVCERWMQYEKFLSDMGRRPSARHSIDRINNDGNYEPGNVRWATPEEQVRNRAVSYTCRN